MAKPGINPKVAVSLILIVISMVYILNRVLNLNIPFINNFIEYFAKLFVGFIVSTPPITSVYIILFSLTVCIAALVIIFKLIPAKPSKEVGYRENNVREALTQILNKFDELSNYIREIKDISNRIYASVEDIKKNLESSPPQLVKAEEEVKEDRGERPTREKSIKHRKIEARDESIYKELKEMVSKLIEINKMLTEFREKQLKKMGEDE